MAKKKPSSGASRRGSRSAGGAARKAGRASAVKSTKRATGRGGSSGRGTGAAAKGAKSGRAGTGAKKKQAAARPAARGGTKARATGKATKAKSATKSTTKATTKPKAKPKPRGKVGSSAAAAKRFAPQGDFGIPPEKVVPGRTGSPSAPADGNAPRAGEEGDRTHGVGMPATGTGSSSGGDLDTDTLGVGAAGTGLAQDPPTGLTTDESATDGSSEELASGGPARGENQQRPATPGVGTTINRAGGDASTTGPETPAEGAGDEDASGPPFP